MQENIFAWNASSIGLRGWCRVNYFHWVGLDDPVKASMHLQNLVRLVDKQPLVDEFIGKSDD